MRVAFGLDRQSTRLMKLVAPWMEAWGRLRQVHAGVVAILLGFGMLILSGCQNPVSCDLRGVVCTHATATMKQHRIPGMAIAVVHGNTVECFSFGVASRESGEPVTPNTLFELGSVSKTFTGLLGAYASALGQFSFDDRVSRRWSELAGSAFDHVTMDQLATYSAGGLPLQFPSEVGAEAEMIAYFRRWRPSFEPGVQRLYSNPSIGLFGLIAAKSAGEEYAAMMTETILPALAMHDTYLSVPPSEMRRYAFGYDRDDQPVRVSPGLLDQEAYGIKSTAADMGRFLHAQMYPPADATLARALEATKVGRYSVSAMIQGLGWEMYAFPVGIDELLAGNSTEISLNPNAVCAARTLDGPVLLNKTGSTSGFGAYVLFVPAEKFGVVLLANRNFPIPARVQLAYAILEARARR